MKGGNKGAKDLYGASWDIYQELKEYIPFNPTPLKMYHSYFRGILGPDYTDKEIILGLRISDMYGLLKESYEYEKEGCWVGVGSLKEAVENFKPEEVRIYYTKKI